MINSPEKFQESDNPQSQTPNQSNSQSNHSPTPNQTPSQSQSQNPSPQEKPTLTIICPDCEDIPFVQIIPTKEPKIEIKCKCGFKSKMKINDYLTDLQNYQLNSNCVTHPLQNAITFCEQCCQNYCEECTNIHESETDHNLKPISNEINYEIDCDDHNNNNFQYYCIDCQIHLCNECNVDDHLNDDHQIVDLIKMSYNANKIYYNEYINYFLSYTNSFLQSVKNRVVKKLSEGDNNDEAIKLMDDYYEIYYEEIEQIFNIMKIINDNYKINNKINYYQLSNFIHNSKIIYEFYNYIEDDDIQNEYDSLMKFFDLTNNIYFTFIPIIKEENLDNYFVRKSSFPENIPYNKLSDDLENKITKDRQIINKTMQDQDGNEYSGNFLKLTDKINPKKHYFIRQGYGTYKKKEGGLYSGTWSNDEANGKGRETYNETDEGSGTYYGEFKNNLKNGYGIYYFSSGQKYFGEVENNKHTGFGKIYLTDGSVFIGEGVDGVFEGFGIYYFSDGTKYIGLMSDNMKNGYGIGYLNGGNIYEGMWKNDKFDGFGVNGYKNGDRFEGFFKDGKRIGYGFLYFFNGNVYQGMFMDKMNGKGIIFYNSGKVSKVDYVMGKKTKEEFI